MCLNEAHCPETPYLSLTPGGSTVSGLRRTKTTDRLATEDNEDIFNFDTSKEPEGKEYGYTQEGLGYGT